MQEAKGFKGDVGRQKDLNRARKKDAKTQKQKRADKITKLSQSDKHWRGLEDRDIRTPERYFREAQERQEKVESIKARLDDLMHHLQGLKAQKNTTPAYRQIVDDEIKKVEVRKDKKQSMDKARSVVNHISTNSVAEAVGSIKDALDLHAYRHAEPFLKLAGEEMDYQIFGHK